jgi:hypothetical protein
LKATKVQVIMTADAQRDEIGLFIPTLLTAQLCVVNLQIPSGAAGLASPTISFQNSLPQ